MSSETFFFFFLHFLLFLFFFQAVAPLLQAFCDELKMILQYILFPSSKWNIISTLLVSSLKSFHSFRFSFCKANVKWTHKLSWFSQILYPWVKKKRGVSQNSFTRLHQKFITITRQQKKLLSSIFFKQTIESFSYSHPPFFTLMTVLKSQEGKSYKISHGYYLLTIFKIRGRRTQTRAFYYDIF